MLILQYTDQIKLFLSLPKSSHISKNLQKDTSKIWLWDQAYLETGFSYCTLVQ